MAASDGGRGERAEKERGVAVGRVAFINVSQGGVPKRAVTECRIGPDGVDGDYQHDREHHGGPERAVCLFSLERIRLLQAEGHPIAPGTIGENLTLEGLDWTTVSPGARLDVGEARLELTRHTSPCSKIAGSFRAGAFSRVSENIHPGWSRVCARVLKPGTVRVGDPVRVWPAAPGRPPRSDQDDGRAR